METASQPQTTPSYPQKPTTTIQDSLATLQGSSLLLQPSTIELNAITDKLTEELTKLNFTNVDLIVSQHPDLFHVKNEQEHQTISTRIYWTLLKNIVAVYRSSEIILREHLQELVFGLYMFAVDRGIEFQPYQHTEIVLFMAQLDAKKALAILKTLPETNWSEQSHAMAYHLEWRQAPPHVYEAEQIIEKAAQEVEQVEEDDLEMLEHPPVLTRYKSLLDCCITPEESALLQSRLRQKHWLSLRIKFEYVWRRIIEANAYASPKEKALPIEIHGIAVELVHSIITLALHFEEYEYAWYWPERSGLTSELEILVDLIDCCREAIKGGQPEIWTARGWVLYKDVLEMKQMEIIGSEDYISFMEKFTLFIVETEGSKSLITLPRIYSDMIPLCSAIYFPIPDSVLYPLMEQCWLARNEPRARWGAAFDKIMEVYILFKHYKSRHDSQFPTAHYFTPQNFVLMLKMCTSNGALEEFKLLNRDVMMIEKVDDEYVAKIKQGYSNFISRGQEEKVVEQRKITITTSQENLEMIKSLLVSCLQ